MNRYALRVVVLLTLVGLVCGCQQPLGHPEPEHPPGPPAANPPKPKSLVVRSVRPPDDPATKTKPGIVSYGLTGRDLDQIAALPGVADLVPVRLLPTEVQYLDRTAAARVVATVADYADASALALAGGRFLTDPDDTGMENVCVLGAEVAAKLFPKEDPLGKTVAARAHFFHVVGVLEKKPAADGDVYIPLRTSRARFGDVIRIKGKNAERVELHEIIVRVGDPDKAPAVTDAVREALKKSHPTKDWEVTAR